MPTPLDEYDEAKQKLAAERNQDDLETWQTWKADPHPENLSKLLGRFQDDFGRTIRKFKAPNINEAAMRANMSNNAIKAFAQYDPDKGTMLRTYVNTHLSRADRFNRSNQNMAFIPEDKSKLIGPIDQAHDHLSDMLGRPPQPFELAAHLTSIGVQAPGKKPITSALVSEIQGLRRADIRDSTFESDPSTIKGETHQQVVNLLPQELKGDEVAVFEYMFGRNGKPKVESTGDIARRMGKSPSQISRIRGRIEGKYRGAV